jgi:hypothetical protein
MKLAQAKATFIEEQKQRDANETSALVDSVELLYGYFSNISLDEITSARLREFLSRWYLEETITRSTSQNRSTNFPNTQTIIASLTEFFRWIEESVTNEGNNENLPEALTQQPLRNTSARERLAVIQSLQETLPRAIEITNTLSHHLANRGGAFAFPEFLTSFEEGGHSEYDIGDASSELSAIEGYFQILRVDGTKVSAEERISERQVSPIIFPEEVARLLRTDFIINLELVCFESCWQIVNCGFAYPPDTEI